MNASGLQPRHLFNMAVWFDPITKMAPATGNRTRASGHSLELRKAIDIQMSARPTTEVIAEVRERWRDHSSSNLLCALEFRLVMYATKHAITITNTSAELSIHG